MELLGLGQNPYQAHPRGGAAEVPAGQSRRAAALHRRCWPAFPSCCRRVRALAARRHRRSRSALYAATCHFDWNLPAYPDGKVWYFNPMAWQVVFYVGAALRRAGPRLAWLDRFRWPTLRRWPCCIFCFAAFIALSWHYNSLERLIPAWIARQIYPIDKTNIDILRFVHFLAIAWLVRLAVRPTHRSSGGGYSSQFAGAASIHCRYSAWVLFLRSRRRSSSRDTKIQSCRRSS